MQGVYLKFFITEKQRHQGKLAYEWLLGEAHRIGIPGGSVFRAIAGYGRHGVMHEAHFFELAGELPVEAVFALSAEDADRLLAHLRSQGLNLVYVRIPAEFGVVDGSVGTA